MPAAIIALIPALVSVAEKIFPGKADAPKRGAEKKSYVMRCLEIAWDIASEKGILPEAIRGHKDVALAILSQIIDETVAALKK